MEGTLSALKDSITLLKDTIGILNAILKNTVTLVKDTVKILKAMVTWLKDTAGMLRYRQ